MLAESSYLKPDASSFAQRELTFKTLIFPRTDQSNLSRKKTWLSMTCIEYFSLVIIYNRLLFPSVVVSTRWFD